MKVITSCSTSPKVARSIVLCRATTRLDAQPVVMVARLVVRSSYDYVRHVCDHIQSEIAATGFLNMFKDLLATDFDCETCPRPLRLVA